MKLLPLAFAFVFVAGCASTQVGHAPSGDDLVSKPVDDGWTNVREPGWFTLNFPGQTTTKLVSVDLTDDLRQELREVVFRTDHAMAFVGYAEAATEDRAHQTLEKLRGPLVAPTIDGVHVTSSRMIDFAGVKANEIATTTSPRTPTNPTDDEIAERTLLFTDGARVYVLVYRGTNDAMAVADAFFASFKFEK